MSSAATRNGVLVTDSQVHIWAASSPERPWPAEFASTPHGPPEVSAEAVLAEMDRVGIQSAIIVPPSFEGDRNDLALAAAHTYPDRFRVQGRFRLDLDGARDEILDSMRDPYLLGLRITFNAGAASWLIDGTIDWLWPFVAANRIPVSLFPWAGDALADEGQLAKLDEVASHYPDARISIDHFGVPMWAGPDDVDASVHRISELARHPNVALKVSALPTILHDQYTVDRVRPLLGTLVDAFGPSRLFWGSDLTRSACSYEEQLDVCIQALRDYSSDDVSEILGRGLRTWLGWSTEDSGAPG